jgi:hypothetical protein
VLRDEARERDGQVEAERYLSAAGVHETVELLVGLLAALARQDLLVFEGGRIDRKEAVGTEDDARLLDERLAGDRLLRQVVPESLERPRLDQRHGRMLREPRGACERTPGAPARRRGAVPATRRLLAAATECASESHRCR